MPPQHQAQSPSLSDANQNSGPHRRGPQIASAPPLAGTAIPRAQAPTPRRPAPSRADFKTAARAVTVPAPKPSPRKTKKRGEGDAHRFSTDWIVEDYLALCRDPLSDLQRWLDEDKKKPSAPRISQEAHHAPHTASRARTLRFPRDALHEVSGRVRAHDHQGRDSHDVPGGSRAGAGEHRELQQVQTDRNLGSPEVAHAESGGEISAIGGYYAGLIAAARATLRPHEAAALVRNLLSQKAQAVRAAQDRMHAARTNLRNACRNRDPSHLGGQRLG